MQYNTIQYNIIKYNTIQYNTIQYNTIQYNTIQSHTLQYNTIQVAGAGFRGPLLICLLNLTLNEKSASHILQFVSKYHVFLNSLWAQIWDHTHCSSGLAAIHY